MVDLSNSPYTTNRILEIPQDIKLEINSSNKLVLKTGSKVYIPNGFESDGTTPHFDIITIESDIVNNNSHNGYHENFWFHHNRTSIATYPDTNNFSGPTQPTGSYTYAVWYDTANNVIKNTSNGGSTWISGISLPICRALGGASNTVTSIDQVFNGFGYIGSTVFALPGVKVQIPNGRNEDGTCKATLTTLTSVKTQTFTSAAQRGWYLQINGASSGNSPVYSDTQPSQNYIRWFSQKDNQWYDTHSSPELNSETYILPLASFNTDSTGKITSFEPCTVDSVANSNASNFSQAGRSYLSGLGMPSSRKEDWTLLASGNTYTAPANGYMLLRRVSTGVGQYVVGMDTNKNNYYDICWSSATGQNLCAIVPCLKGAIIQFDYSAPTAIQFRFIYAEGER